MNTLESRYRRALRWYPKTWRAANEDVVVSTLLDVAEAENRSAPTFRERLDLARNGVAARLGVYLPYWLRSGVASVALATGTAYAAIYFLFHTWAPWTQAAGGPEALLAYFHPELRFFGPFVNPGVVLCAIWALAFVLAVAGRTAWARAILVLSIAIAVAMPAVIASSGATMLGPTSTNLGFLAVLALLGLAGGPANRTRLVSGTAGILLVLIGVYSYHGAFGSAYLDDRFFWRFAANVPNLTVLITVALGAAVVLAFARRGRAGAILAISTLPWCAVWFVWYFEESRDGAQGLFLVAGIVAVLAIGMAALLRWGGITVSITRRPRS